MKKTKYIFDLFLIFAMIIFNIVLGIVSNSYWLATLNGILGLLSIFSQAKGLFFAPIIGIIDCIFYGIFSLQFNYMGEFIVYIFILIPIYIYAIIQWILNKNSDSIIIPNKLSIKEIKYLVIASFLIILGSYFLLNLLSSDKIILNTLSLYTLTFSNYLLSRRCLWGFIYYIINDIILIILWLTTMIQGEHNILSFFVCIIAYFFCDIYGIINWLRIKNNSTNENIK